MNRIAFALLAALLAAAPLRSADYLHGLDAVALLPPPPPLHDPEDLADRESTFRIYSARTPEEVATGKAEHSVSIFAFAPVVGPVLKPGRLPKLEALSAEILAEAKPVIDAGKNHWGRRRPFVDDPARFSEPGDPEKSFGYPSGHSTRGTVLALILAEVFPEKRDAILAKGRAIGWVRVEIGVHTPLDIYAGRVLGKAIAGRLLADPQFEEELAAVKAEAAAAEHAGT